MALAMCEEHPEQSLIAGAKRAPVTKMALAMCAEHPEQSLIGCCRNCNNSPVCTLCIFNTHKKHEICSFVDVMDENNTFLKDTVGALGGHLGDLDIALAKVSAQKKSLDESSTAATVVIMEGFRKVRNQVLAHVNGVTTKNQTKLNGQHLTLEAAKKDVVCLKTAALKTIDCIDHGHHSVKVSNIRREMKVLNANALSLKLCSTVLISCDIAMLHDIAPALVVRAQAPHTAFKSVL